MTDKEKSELIALIEEEIAKVTMEIVELDELTQPIVLDSALGRMTRMVAIASKGVNEGRDGRLVGSDPVNEQGLDDRVTPEIMLPLRS